MNKLYIIIAGIALFLGLAGFWYWQRNGFSKDILNFEIIAPKEAVMGQEITYVVKWKNKGSALLENPTLTFEYPQGTLPSSERGNLRTTQTVDDIYPGQEKTVEFKARLFGAQGDVKEVKANLAYNPKNLQARYASDTSGVTVISSVPLNFDADLPSRIESGQPLTVTLNYFSNSDFPLSDTRIKVEYPDGFDFQSATPAPIGANEWPVGLLNKGKGGRIVIKGIVHGQLQEAKNFHATFGSWKNGEFTLFKDLIRGVEISQVQMNISQTVNGSESESVNPGDLLHYEISFTNVSDKDLENLFLIANLSGAFFDFSSVQANGGTFKQGDNSIVWEAKDNSGLRFLPQDGQGSVEFWIKTKNSIDLSQQGSQTKNFVLQDKISLSDASQEFDVKVNSGIQINQAAYFQDEVFGNSGPLPPQAGQGTTYTIIWKAQNLYNDVKNAKVKAILPQGVELTGKIFPEDSSLTFDSKSREIVWIIGDMSAETGLISPPASVAFQVLLTPDSSQRGSFAQLAGKARITADDAWTIQSILADDSALDTSTLNDSTSKGKGIVQ